MPAPTTTSWSQTRRSIPTRIRRRILAQARGCALSIEGICGGTPREVDHIVGVADATAAGWDREDIDDPANLQAVCTPCHRLKTQLEQRRGLARATAARPKQRPSLSHPGLRT